jgi:multidrug efflux pump subunit AcrA (membrane-fusion protein)
MAISSPNVNVGTPADAALGRSHRLLEEIAQLLQRCPPTGEFYAEYLQRVLAAVRGIAGAVWTRSGPDQFLVQYQCNRGEIGLDGITNGPACHHELLRVASKRQEPLWVPPRSGPDTSGGRVVAANLSAYGLLLAPILVDGEATGVVEIWLDFYHDSQLWRGAARFLAEVAGFAAAYQHKTRLRHLQDQQRLWERLEAFVRRLHASLDPRQVAFVAANESRHLIGCDQVTVALRRKDVVRVEAVSGATQVDGAAALVTAMARLCQTVLEWGETLHYSGVRDDGLPPTVRTALDEYLKQSDSRRLIVVPLRDERDTAAEACRSALLAESFEASVAVEDLRSRATVLAPHVAAALYNAAAHADLPLGWLARAVGRGRSWLGTRRWAKLGLPVATALALAAVLLAVPASLRREATGQLLPGERQYVFAPVAGRIIELKAANGDLVHKGQELLFLEDLDNQLKVQQLDIKISSAEHRLAILNEQLGRPGPDDDRDALTKERINQTYELRKALAERGILLHGSRNPHKTPVTAPLTGKVVTFDAHETLVGKTVKPGDPLLRVANVKGGWAVELYIPEDSVGHVLEGLRQSPDGSVEVDVLLASRPDRVWKGRLTRAGLGGETQVKNNAVVVPARVEIVDLDLISQLETMPVGVELRAKVNCGSRPLGYVLLCDLLEFLYEHVWF